MSNWESRRSVILPLLLVLIAGPALGVANIFGMLPVAGVVLFLFAALIMVLYKKTYHLLVLSGVWLLFCVIIEPSPSDLVFCAAVPLGLVTGIYRPRLHGSSLYAVLLFGAYFIACLPGIALAPDQSGALRYFAITLYLFVLALFICTYASNDNVNSLLRAYILAAFCSFVAGLIGYLGFFPDWLMADVYRVKGLFKDPNVFGPFFVPAILLVIDDIKRRLLLRTHAAVHIVLIILFTLAVIFSFSRGAWVNLLVSLFLYYLLSGKLLQLFKPRYLVSFAAVLLVIVGVLFSPAMTNAGVGDFLLQRAQLQTYDQNRFNSQKGGIQLVLKNPLGCGPGQFENEIAEITKYRLSAHSLYVRTAAENGVAGFVFLFAALFYLLIQLLQRYKQINKPQSIGTLSAAPTAVPPVTAATLRKVAKPSSGTSNLTSGIMAALMSAEADIGPSLPVIIAVLCGLLVSSLAVDTIHWRHFWFFIGIGLYQLNRERQALPPDV